MCHSTNEYAEKLIEDNNFFEGTTIVTSNQTKGKGQRGNKWETEAGKNLTFSVIFKPQFLAVQKQFYLNIFTSLSIINVLAKYASGFKVKWPNDIYWYNYKIGGILIENKLKLPQLESSIVGIGLNINQIQFSGLNATSLIKITNMETNLESILSQILSNLEANYLRLKKGDFEALLAEYYDSLYWRGEVHTFKSVDYFLGEIIGINETGKLVINTENQLRYFDLKEIQFIE
jgi:BirA family transcriptional regulator, biotin operon repressor / biotin---[acetyl-CoA-carboxylase] ligase